jgi:ESCRT-II complex subunit VPS22
MGLRRPVGVAAVQRIKKQDAAAEALGSSLADDRHKHVQEQMQEFKKHLEAFAIKYRSEINKDPEFRLAFGKMARSIGVDPLVSTKGFWGEALGLSSFYCDLGVQIVDVCLSLRDRTGGLVSLEELTSRIRVMRGGSVVAAAASDKSSSKHTKITSDDVVKALEKLSVLGGGYRVVYIGTEKYIVSVPYELNDDQTTVLRHCVASLNKSSAGSPVTGTGSPLAALHVYGWITAVSASRELGWDVDRTTRALLRLAQEGMAWVDDGHPSFKTEGFRYYFPAVNMLKSS